MADQTRIVEPVNHRIADALTAPGCAWRVNLKELAATEGYVCRLPESRPQIDRGLAALFGHVM
jgi:hypothetical protein